MYEGRECGLKGVRRVLEGEGRKVLEGEGLKVVEDGKVEGEKV
jgi:hypothetical protein